MAEKNPFEIAREALMLLTTRKLVPTPDNYQAVFSEISGTPNVTPFPAAPMRKIAQALKPQSSAQRKQRDALEHAIERSDWGGVQEALVGFASFAAVGAPAPELKSVPSDNVRVNAAARAAMGEFLEQLARLIENTLPALGTDDVRLSEQVAQLLKVIREPASDIATLKPMLANFSHRLAFAAEDQAEIRDTLLKLLHVIISNIGELSLEDNWLKRQVDALTVVATPPLTLRRLDDLERRLKDVMFKQINAKGRTLEAQEQMRHMLATFIERLAQMTDSTSAYHDKMEHSARLIEQAKSIEDIAPVMQDVISTTRGIAYEMERVRDELRGMRDTVTTTKAEVAKLHQELDSASAEARHDALTGALNRRGLDEALERELADVRRKQTPLCMALLDIDNFKKLNDNFGHATGDAALTHLVTVTRECMRAQDTLARYGGEEFVIVMPDTALDKGMDAMMRLQRALTKKFFLAGAEKVLITFSAGVAQLAPEEASQDALKRADQAVYLAKRAGKNRVIGA